MIDVFFISNRYKTGITARTLQLMTYLQMKLIVGISVSLAGCKTIGNKFQS